MPVEVPLQFSLTIFRLETCIMCSPRPLMLRALPPDSPVVPVCVVELLLVFPPLVAVLLELEVFPPMLP